MSNLIFSPAITTKDLQKALDYFKDELSNEKIYRAEQAIKTSKERKIPDPHSFNLQRIKATDGQDLNLKLHLATAPIALALSNEEISKEEFQALILPISRAVFDKLMELLIAGKIFSNEIITAKKI